MIIYSNDNLQIEKFEINIIEENGRKFDEIYGTCLIEAIYINDEMFKDDIFIKRYSILFYDEKINNQVNYDYVIELNGIRLCFRNLNMAKQYYETFLKLKYNIEKVEKISEKIPQAFI